MEKCYECKSIFGISKHPWEHKCFRHQEILCEHNSQQCKLCYNWYCKKFCFRVHFNYHTKIHGKDLTKQVVDDLCKFCYIGMFHDGVKSKDKNTFEHLKTECILNGQKTIFYLD